MIQLGEYSKMEIQFYEYYRNYLDSVLYILTSISPLLGMF